MKNPNKKFELKLVEETALRLKQSGNDGAASCLLNIAAAMSLNYEDILAEKLCITMGQVLTDCKKGL